MAKRKKTAGSGRQKGTPNKATAEIKALAQLHSVAALKVAVTLMTDPETPAHTRLSAAGLVLEYGVGKPKQAFELTGEGGAPIVIQNIQRSAE